MEEKKNQRLTKLFKLNQSENRLVRLEAELFGALNLQERPDLQEWLAKTPEALGEDLLIIQKEFDGFEDTRERLDLLGIDKKGRLVVIEIKRDDSGRDVVWQGVKYLAYCSSLKKEDIIQIYQEYLEECGTEDKAVPNLSKFLGKDLDEVVTLNSDNEQRLILVAANFRKEVTTAVLFLRKHGMQAQCFEMVPYRIGEEILINLQQIIPTPEPADYMIGLADKKSEENSMWLNFWAKTLVELRMRGAQRWYKKRSPKRPYLQRTAEVSGCQYRLHIEGKKKEASVDLYLERDPHENEWIFDQLKEKKGEIEERFGAKLDWPPPDGSQHRKIHRTKPFDVNNEENWPEMVDWLCEHIVKLEEAFKEPLGLLSQKLKSRGAVSLNDP